MLQPHTNLNLLKSIVLFIVIVDGIYLARNACILICCNETHILGWYVCRYEHSNAWEALLRRISSPTVVISDGGTGLQNAWKERHRMS